MNRHHPYGGYENSSPRRGGGFHGHGPDRNHRYPDRGGRGGGRGYGRGRGGGGGGASHGGGNFSSYDSGYGGGYDAHPPPPPHMPPQQADYGGYGGYSGHETMQDSYYQSAPRYSPPPPENYGPGYGGYDQGPSSYNDDGYGRPPPNRPRNHRKEWKEEKVADSVIEERIGRERPCRTLFIRNIKYETNSDDVYRRFAAHGDIKTFFDLISNRGMVFVTYFDIRHAERARESLQGSEISGRPIDVHYSLPRDDHVKGIDRERNQQMQGTMQITLRDSRSGSPLDENEVRRKFTSFGDIKSISPADRPDSKYVEFYDMRSCDQAFEALRYKPFQDGILELMYSWDEPPAPPNTRPGFREPPEDVRTPKGIERGGGSGGGGGGGGRPGRGRGGKGGRGRGGGGGGGGAGGGPSYDDDYDRRGSGGGGSGDYGRGRDHGGRGRYEDDFGRGRNGYDDRYDGRGSYSGPSSSGPPPGYGGPPPPTGPSGYGGPPPPPPPPPAAPSAESDRLEQARKVQQLLAALKQPQASPTTPTNPAPPAPPAPQGYPPNPNMGAPPPTTSQPSYYPPPPASYAGGPPPGAPAAYPTPPPIASPPPGAGPPAGGVALPPNITALLQQMNGPQAQQAPAAYGAPPPVGAGVPPPPNMNQPGFQQLMSYLSQPKQA